MYVTGQAADLAALQTAIFNACTANGWVLNTDVLSKGGVFVKITISGSSLAFLGGLGIDGSDALTTPGPSSPVIGNFAQVITYPVTYEVHINTLPDEVYVVISYSVDFYQWAAWGQSDVAGVPGAGVWYAATKWASGVRPISFPNAGPGLENPSLFVEDEVNNVFAGQLANSFIHHGIDGTAWNVADGPQPTAWPSAEPLVVIQPNAWNDEAVLIPVNVWVRRAEGNKVSLAAQLRHARYLRIDFHDPGDIITLGPDQWQVYPWYRKDAAQRDAVGQIEHTGTFGWAVRYTGP